MVGVTHEESTMKLTVFAASLAFLLWGAAPAFAGPPGCVGPDSDGDLIDDCAANCSDAITITLEISRGHERKRAVRSEAEWTRVRLSTNVTVLNRP